MRRKIFYLFFFFTIYTQSKATEFITWDITTLNKIKNSTEYNSLYTETM